MGRPDGVPEMVRDHIPPYSPDHLVEWGSITKAVTATAVRIAITEGLFSGGDEVARLLPRLPEAHFSVLELLEHRSGLPRMAHPIRALFRRDPYADVVGRRLDPATVVPLLPRGPPVLEPRVRSAGRSPRRYRGELVGLGRGSRAGPCRSHDRNAPSVTARARAPSGPRRPTTRALVSGRRSLRGGGRCLVDVRRPLQVPRRRSARDDDTAGVAVGTRRRRHQRRHPPQPRVCDPSLRRLTSPRGSRTAPRCSVGTEVRRTRASIPHRRRP